MASKLKDKMAKGAAAVAAVGAVASIVMVGGSANADPQQLTNSFYGYGSDTTQDVTNALAGFSNGIDFTPVKTTGINAATGDPFSTQLVSWDAFATTCITPKTGAPQILRPNGSGNGQRILASANVTGARWPLNGNGSTCGPSVGTSGFVDFSRSSSGPSSNVPTGPMQFLPFARDALSFAYVKPSGTAPVTALTRTQLIALHDTGPQVINDPDGPGGLPGTPVIACAIQDGSGTYQTWMTQLGLTNGTNSTALGDAVGTTLCNSVTSAGFVDTSATNGFRTQENNSPEFLRKAALLPSMSHPNCDGDTGTTAPVPCTDAQLIIGYSASQFIARYNESVGKPDSRLDTIIINSVPVPANGGLGAIDALGYPIRVTADPNGTPGITGVDPAPNTPAPVGLTGDESLAPDASYYAAAQHGRDVYFIVPFAKISGFLASANLINMFVSTPDNPATAAVNEFVPSRICSQVATIQQHGFLSLGNNCMVALDSLRANYPTS